MADDERKDPRPLRLDDLPLEILASVVAYCEGGVPTHDEDPATATTTTTTTTTTTSATAAAAAMAPGSHPSPPPPPPPPPRDLATIRSLRFTNRLLASVAAPHLVRVLDVAMTPASLARLDAVSRHRPSPPACAASASASPTTPRPSPPNPPSRPLRK
ncbi:uncharacterized protein GLRG_01102 [Colletotrichum graminicola M1.001]|uniref:Uncharacterized protein n=1 Tax=Colletotrichum graminicola (strain M1.001 / M2 / FGSC 10212) TaxID=645133 RepID=E3Q5J1_COLGM|nr:uncharacterized protein GLRG_01102 [Colletotrichum graminicola M1.001]EFQ25958.1 hypothetical protein GLRG_01102 [Colletotrichum graminicola M1.001]